MYDTLVKTGKHIRVHPSETFGIAALFHWFEYSCKISGYGLMCNCTGPQPASHPYETQLYDTQLHSLTCPVSFQVSGDFQVKWRLSSM